MKNCESRDRTHILEKLLLVNLFFFGKSVYNPGSALGIRNWGARKEGNNI